MIRKVLRSKAIPPTFLIIGAQKAGTTALFQYLSSHSEIIAPNQKEIDFFWLDHLYHKGQTWYLEHFPKALPYFGNRKVSFEASPHYLFSSKAAQRIFDFNPEMKIIVILRNPIDRAFSQYQMYQRRRFNVKKNRKSAEKYGGDIQEFFEALNSSNFFKSFDEVIEQEWEAIQKGEEMAPYLISQGFYDQQVENYLQFFPKEQILFLEHESFKSHSQDVLNIVSSFLGLKEKKWTTEELKRHHEGNYNKKINIKTYLRLQQIFHESNQKLFELIGKEFDW